MTKKNVLEIIDKAQVSFMATVDGNVPRVRPMMTNVIWNDKIYVATFTNSQKVKQLKQNSQTEIVWMDIEMRHVRINGKVVFCEDAALKKKYFDLKADILKCYYSGVDDPNYTLLEIHPEEVLLMDVGAQGYTKVNW